MKAHFVTEEDILMETKFPWIEEHVASHRQVILKLPRLIDDSEKVMDGEQGWNKLVDELVECLMDDTFKADMMFKSFLEKQST